MKLVSAGLGLVVVLLLVATLYEQRKTSGLPGELVAIRAELGGLKAQIGALAREREATNRELHNVAARITELEKRSVAPVARSGTTDQARAATVPPPAQPAARPGVSVTAPTGWGKNGAKPDWYVVGVDSTEPWGGMPSAYVQSLAPTVEGGFGGMMQTTSAENYVGKRVRLSGWLKTEEAIEGGGHLWLRIDGQERGKMLGFDNMDNRAVKGSSDWQEASVVLDVPAGSSALAYGFFVSGGGKMWVNGQKIEEVGPDVPTTNMVTKPPVVPRNLGFDPNRPK